MDGWSRYAPFGLAAVFAVAWAVMGSGAQASYALIPGLAALVCVTVGIVQIEARWGTASAALLNAGAAWYLLGLKVAAKAGPSACSIDETFDCDKLNASASSELGGVPIALLGLALYAGLLVGAVLAKPGDDRDQFLQLSGVLNVANLVYSAYLLYMSKVLGAFCVVCITMYLGHAVMLYAAWRGLKDTERGLFDDLGGLLGTKSTARVVGTALIVLILLWNMFAGQLAGPSTAPKVTADGKKDWSELYEAVEGDVQLNGSEPILGDRDARILVVEFADFACPHCARAEKELSDLVKMRPDIQVRFKPFPLTGKCNPALEDYGSGEERCRAAIAAECTVSQGKFWPMAHQLFTNQGYFEAEQIRFMAEACEVDLDAFDACVESPEAKAAVEAHAAAGGALGLQGTPALFVKGLTDSGWISITRGVPAILELAEAVDDDGPLPTP